MHSALYMTRRTVRGVAGWVGVGEWGVVLLIVVLRRSQSRTRHHVVCEGAGTVHGHV